MRKQYLTLDEAVADRAIAAEAAAIQVNEIAAYLVGNKTGYIALPKDGLGSGLHGHQLPFRESYRWHDSFIVYLEPGSTASDLLVRAINDAIPY